MKAQRHRRRHGRRAGKKRNLSRKAIAQKRHRSETRQKRERLRLKRLRRAKAAKSGSSGAAHCYQPGRTWIRSNRRNEIEWSSRKYKW